MSIRITGMGGGYRSLQWRDPRQPRRHVPQPEAGTGGDVREAPVQVSQAVAEQARAQMASLNQAIHWTESALALAVAAEQGLASIAAVLERLQRRLRAVPPARSNAGPTPEGSAAPVGGVTGPAGWAQVLAALREDLREMDALARDTRFGQQALLDGSLGCRAAVVGAALELVAVGASVRSSPPEGYAVWLTQEPTRPTLLGAVPLTPALLAQPLELGLEEGGRAIRFTSAAGQ
ncbi:MAG TPA: hypothetical protein VL359_09830, partial [bacterium]|nr:hypothetical protein [bacterium]